MTTSAEVALLRLYADMERAAMMPLWTARADLMPAAPMPAARPHHWDWSTLRELAERSGELVPVGRGGERRAIALANPGLDGQPYATPTLWCAVQLLGPREVAPAHRHSQSAFRFILEGEGVWTLVDGDPVAMRRGDLLLTAGWAWHEHHNTADDVMLWLDGLDIPLVAALDAGFFEFGPEEITDRATPQVSRSERLWGHPGLLPVGEEISVTSPLAAYRWEHTDAALTAQLELADGGHYRALGSGHAAVRFVHPGTGRDALATMRLEMHRVAREAVIEPTRVVGSSVWTVFNGSGRVSIADDHYEVSPGDVVAVPSWAPVHVAASDDLDLFVFSDAPVYEALNLATPRRTVP